MSFCSCHCRLYPKKNAYKTSIWTTIKLAVSAQKRSAPEEENVKSALDTMKIKVNCLIAKDLNFLCLGSQRRKHRKQFKIGIVDLTGISNFFDFYELVMNIFLIILTSLMPLNTVF
jgi:hypothetical protein